MSTKSRGLVYLDETESEVWRAFRELVRHVGSSISSDLVADSGLSDADYSVLSNLSERSGDEMRVLELAERLSWSKGRTSHQIVRMERRGLVARRPHVLDGRGSVVVLTPAGRAKIEAAAPPHVASVRRHFLDLLDERDRRALMRLAGHASSFVPSKPPTNPRGPAAVTEGR